MKQITLSAIFIIWFCQLFAQSTAITVYTKEDYLRKSKTQKTIGFVMAATGVTLAATGFIIINNKINGPIDPNDPFLINESGGSVIVIFAGAGLAVGSIPFFIIAGKNSKKAAAISFNYQNTPLLQQGNMALRRQPAVRITIGL